MTLLKCIKKGRCSDQAAPGAKRGERPSISRGVQVAGCYHFVRSPGSDRPDFGGRFPALVARGGRASRLVGEPELLKDFRQEPGHGAELVC